MSIVKLPRVDGEGDRVGIDLERFEGGCECCVETLGAARKQLPSIEKGSLNVMTSWEDIDIARLYLFTLDLRRRSVALGGDDGQTREGGSSNAS